jgi:uncharacterized protein (DUF1810 family)
METKYNLQRFVIAQQEKYNDALLEIKNGAKQSHWMWFIFPQIKDLGFSEYNLYFAINDLEEAKQYYNHPVLGKRLIEISKELLKIKNKTALEIFGNPDAQKLQSSMTLFSLINNSNPVFQEVLDKYYNGDKDEKTIIKLNALQ